jgi:protein-tyrosine kinase
VSRIHEALKKAEQEKAAQTPSSERSLLDRGAEVDTSTPISAVAVREGQRESSTAVRDRDVSLRYADLVKRCSHPEWKASSVLQMSLASETGKILAERFRTLRSRLYQIAATRTLRRLLVTSSLPSEGKTFVAANLARSFIRQSDRRVLLIDADLRAPRLHTAIAAPSTPGLSDYLRGEADEYSIIQNDPSISNFCFIPCGVRVSNPSELLLRDRMKVLLDTITPCFDWILMDSPPTVPVHDASSLASLCDGVLFVVKAGETDHEIAKKASSEFRDKNLLGVVLNQVEMSDAQGSYYFGNSGKNK